jgi:hypothetical protein
MTTMSCLGVRRRLSAYHDGELPTCEQVAVESHLRDCARCAIDAAELDDVGEALRMGAGRLALQFQGDLDALESEITNRVRVEREESVPAQVGRMFEDMRWGFAALGSIVASMVSLLVVSGICSFGPVAELPGSLAGMMETLGAPAAGVDTRMMMPRAPFGAVMSDDVFNEEDAVFALAAVVTQQGRIKSLELVRSDQAKGTDREQVLRLLDLVSRARLEPARMGGYPLAVRTVLVLAHTTVRGKLPVLPKQSALPAGQFGVALT